MNSLLLSSKGKYSLLHFSILIAAFGMLLLIASSFSCKVFAKTFYVKPTATGARTGATWNDASDDLLAMIKAAASGDEVWVAGGTYGPSFDNSAERKFVMKEGVKIYGGFAGNESSLAERDLSVTANKSILQGSSTAPYVVYNQSLTPTSRLDGFTIKGNTVGIYNTGASPTLVNLIITGGNTPGAPRVFNQSASPILTNCAIIDSPGNGMSNFNSSPILTNCTIAGNTRQSDGYGMYNVSSAPQIRNCIIFGNTRGITYDETPPVIMYSLVQGENNLDPAFHNVLGILNPKFANAAKGDYRLLPCSPAIDRGSNTLFASGQTPDLSGISKDLSGQNRFYSDGTVDMGAYEHESIAGPQGVPGVWYVKEGGTGAGMNWDCPTGDLQAAINAAREGEQIWVAGGIYGPSFQGSDDRKFVLKEGVKVYGGFAGNESSLAARDHGLPANKSILQGSSSSYFVMSNEGLTPATVLDGFTIRGNVIGIYNVRASPTLVNLIITSGSAGGTPRVLNRSASPVMTNCAIINGIGNGMRNESSAPILTNCTIAGFTRSGATAMSNQNSSPQIRNSIISGNTSGISNDATSAPVIRHSLVQGQNSYDPATGNISGKADPVFVNAVEGNYQLQSCSPAVNRGSNTYYAGGQTPDLAGITRDLAYNNRFFGNGVVDMGAFEYQGNTPAHVPGVWYVKTGGTGPGTNWDCATGDLQAAVKNAVAGEQIWVAGGTYQPADNGTFALKEGVKIYGGFAGTETSFSDRGLTILSHKSILQAYGHSVIINAGQTLTTAAVLDGFTIRGSSNGPGIQNSAGSSPMLANLIITENTGSGGMVISDSSPTLMNCAFTGNTSSNGGGLLISNGSPKLVNCSFTGNSAGDGGGIFSSSASLVLVNCVIKGNTATNGGGIHAISSTGSLTNCTIVDNSAMGGGGGVLSTGSSSLQLRNSIVYGNSTGIVNQDAATLAFQYSLVQGQDTPNPSDHNIRGNSDPLFVDAVAGNYRLQPCSPAVNAGFNYFRPGLTPDLSGVAVDLDGHVRLSEHTVDMGAYEFSGATRVLATDGDQAAGTVNGDFMLTTNGANCKILAYLSPYGDAALRGTVTARVWVAQNQPSNFLKRHYQITPTTNADHATARVTLYFTQQEFDDFNAVSTLPLPLDAADTENYRANLRIEKRSGESRDNTGLPGSYDGAITTFTPFEANGNVIWNADASRWEVSFDVEGFSGLFVKTTQSALPLNLINFTATKEAESNLLQWSTTNEVNTDNFEIQRSRDAKRFIKIATVDAAGSGDFRYSYNDHDKNDGINYYRLKMSDLDGTYTFSKIIALKNDSGLAVMYPNPTEALVTFRVRDSLVKTTAGLYDMAGRRIQSVVITSNQQQLNTKALASGIYILKFADGTASKFIKN
jgi:hypothetical protein